MDFLIGDSANIFSFPHKALYPSTDSANPARCLPAKTEIRTVAGPSHDDHFGMWTKSSCLSWSIDESEQFTVFIVRFIFKTVPWSSDCDDFANVHSSDRIELLVREPVPLLALPSSRNSIRKQRCATQRIRKIRIPK